MGQVALGLLWLIDGILQCQPYMFGKTLITGVILPTAAGQPGIIASPITWSAGLIEPHVALFNACAALLQVLVGLGLLARRAVKPALLASFGWAIAIWIFGEGLGMIFTGAANPSTGAPGAALLYILAGAMSWPRGQAAARPDGESSAILGLIGERGARWAWAALWLGSAVLWLLPANDARNSMHDAIATVPSGQGWLSQLLDSTATAASGHGTLIALAAAILSATLGLAVLWDWHAKPFLLLAIVISLAYWLVGQGLGGIFTGRATDVNTAPLVIVIAAMLIGSKRRALRPIEPSVDRGLRFQPDDRALGSVPRDSDLGAVRLVEEETEILASSRDALTSTPTRSSPAQARGGRRHAIEELLTREHVVE